MNSHINKKQPSVLFILKKRSQNWGGTDSYVHKPSGLFNSANFVNHMLKANGFRSDIVEVIDNNSIDKAVFDFNPDIVIIEAIWVTPAKMNELVKLHHHKHRKWIIRNHSELPFLATEGISLQWLLEYSNIPNVYISNNSPIANGEITLLARIHTDVPSERVVFLPNYIPTEEHIPVKHHEHKHHIDISCFGAVRPLKNHVEQAIAAIKYAKHQGKPLRFHINATRLEGKGEPVLKTLRAIFESTYNYELIEHGWLDREEFLKLCSTMDVGLQVSYTETFNIVSADHVLVGVPCIVSDEIPWMPSQYHADPCSSDDIAQKIHVAVKDGVFHQYRGLREYSKESEVIWKDVLLRKLLKYFE